MNSVQLIGRLTKDPEIRDTNSGVKVARFTLAVSRRFKKEGQPDADFIGCIAFGKTAEFIEKYFTKGMKMATEGTIQTGNYTKNDGTKVYTTDVIIGNVEFCESKGDHSSDAKPAAESSFMNIPDGVEDEGLPFN